MKKIEILGAGCPKCRKLYDNAQAAGRALGIDFEIEKIEDIEKIMDYGVMMTPALAIDGKVRVSGKVLSEKDIARLLSE